MTKSVFRSYADLQIVSLVISVIIVTKKKETKTPPVFGVFADTSSHYNSSNFREGDDPDADMIDKTVCEWFKIDVNHKLFVGKITQYDTGKKWYKVLYDDGDEEELSFRQLRVGEWKQIARKSVLWLDEKVCHLHLTVVSHTLLLLIHARSTKRSCEPPRVIVFRGSITPPPVHA